MSEQLIHGILLALHNIALVGCAAAPFYNRNLVVVRGQYGATLHYKLDKVIEDTLQGNAPYCMVFIAVLFLTGLGIPLNHYIYAGAFKSLHLVATVAVSLKMICIFGMVIIMFIIFFQINPRLKELFASFKDGEKPDAKNEQEFFAKRARRKALCETCLKLAIGVLVFSAFMGFSM
ncbi:MAG: hypothetical protein H6696_14845 [Deferribacteres bacterium]|nr:hypothetical protein [candidate division KSB1 bacterium]MCB9503206.1 hypothetical protein [Deferribacteres bacterium]